MAKVHDKFVIELAEVIKGYGNDPDVDDPFHLSEFYRFYELPEIAVSANHFKTMIPLEVVEKNAQPGWIPCTPETMPKMTDIYLVKVRINQYGEGMYPTFRTALWHTASRKWFVHESENSIIGEVTEWMPIPWEGEKDDG